MENLICYKSMPRWDAQSIPAGFKKKHNTKAGTWAKLTVFKGSLKFYQLDEEGNTLNTLIFDVDNEPPFIEPQAWHRIEPMSEDLECQLAFHCLPQDYYAKKYQLSPTHSEVLEFVSHLNAQGITDLAAKDVLDFGCGSGRNSLYLQSLGCAVTGFDKNTHSIDALQSIIDSENLNNMTVFSADATQVELEKTYDVVISTVVLMFLQAETAPSAIRKIQKATKKKGYNVIVSAMDSADYPMSAHDLPFGFGLKTGELSRYYSGWEIIKYNEDVGHLHRLDANGNPIALRFATLIAQKV